MPVQTAILHGPADQWGHIARNPGRSRGPRSKRRGSKIAGITFAGAMLAGIVVNATLLQTGHVPAVASIHDADKAAMQQAALQQAAVSPPAPVPPVVEAPIALVSFRPDIADLTPTGSIAQPRRSSLVKALPTRPTKSRPPLAKAPERRIDGITAFLKGLGRFAAR